MCTVLHLLLYNFFWFLMASFVYFQVCNHEANERLGIFGPLIWKGGTDWEKRGSKNWYIFWQKLTNHPSFVSCLINRKWVEHRISKAITQKNARCSGFYGKWLKKAHDAHTFTPICILSKEFFVRLVFQKNVQQFRLHFERSETSHSKTSIRFFLSKSL